MKFHKHIIIFLFCFSSYCISAQDSSSMSVTNIVTCDYELSHFGIQWNGNTYNSEGTYSVGLTNSSGEDSVAILNIHVITTSTTWLYDTIYSNELPYEWRGKTLNEGSILIDSLHHTGMYVDSVFYEHYCFSTTVLKLTVLPYSPDTIPPSISCLDKEITLHQDGEYQLSANKLLIEDSNNSEPYTLNIDNIHFDCSDIGLNRFVITATDEFGNATSCVSDVTVVGNRLPITIVDSISTDQNTSVHLDVLANDIGISSNIDNYSFYIIDQPKDGSVLLDSALLQVKYQPNVDFYGIDSFLYAVCNDKIPCVAYCDTAKVFIEVLKTNSPPNALNDYYTTSNEWINGNILENDYDLDSNLISVYTEPIQEPDYGELFLNEDGSFEYIPDGEYIGMDSFVYVIFDSGLPSYNDTAKVYIEIISISDYYESTEDLSGETLKTTLHNKIKGHKEFPYTASSTDSWDLLKRTDKDTANTDNVILFYSNWSVKAAQEYNDALGYSIEHVWANSHGVFGTTKGAGTDLHHLRLADITVKSARSNKDFDNGGQIYVDGDGTTLCKSDEDSWEPGDEIKGDVARMLFYMAVRYEGEDDEPDLELVDEVNTADLKSGGKGYHGKLSTLLEWHQADPVDSAEIKRNNVIYSYQGNRNPFIDHPEYVNRIWGTPTVSELMYGADEISIYPNPVSDYINIVIYNDMNYSCEILSIQGKVIKRFDVKGSKLLSTIGIPNGNYIVKLHNPNHTFLKKISVSN